MDKVKVRETLVKALDEMYAKAKKMGIQGVAVASYLDKDSETDWIGEMKVVDTPYNLKEGWNLVGIAWAKAGEVIATKANSGDSTRKSLLGEFCFVGGAYGEVDGNELAFAFSGATSEEDLEVAEYGIEVFKKLIK